MPILAFVGQLCFLNYYGYTIFLEVLADFRTYYGRSIGSTRAYMTCHSLYTYPIICCVTVLNKCHSIQWVLGVLFNCIGCVVVKFLLNMIHKNRQGSYWSS